jgi:plasmid stabilization system protein ParE
MRFFLVRRPFDRHLIFYRVCGHTLDIIAIIHGLRDLSRRRFAPPGAE